MSERRAHLLGSAVSIALGLLIAGCGSSAPAPSPAPDVRAAESSVSAASGGASADAVDACALLSKEEVGALIGVIVDGAPNGVEAHTGCAWENPDTYESVTVDIGAPDTAMDNTLPPLGEPGFPELSSTPGPDGTRIFGGAVEFAAGNRYNSVQVATPVSMSPDESIAAAVTLIQKIKPQIPE